MTTIREQARRRFAAAEELGPYNENGDLDPDEARRLSARCPKHPRTVLAILDSLPGGHLTPEEGREAWPHADERQRRMLAGYFAVDGAA